MKVLDVARDFPNVVMTVFNNIEGAERHLEQLQREPATKADLLLGFEHRFTFRILDALKEDLAEIDAKHPDKMHEIVNRFGERVTLALARDRLHSLLELIEPYRKLKRAAA